MSFTNIIGNILFPKEYSIGGISINTFVSEGHISEVGITQNPVEFGMAVTDNIVAQPFRVSVEGVLTNTSSFFGLIDWGIQGLAGDVASALTGGKIGASKVNAQYQLLLALQRSGERFTLVTGIKSYTNMVIVVLATSQDKDSNQHIRFTASLQEVNIIKTATYEGSLGDIKAKPESPNEVAKSNADTEDRGASISEGGKKASTPVAPKNQSALKGLLGGGSAPSTPNILEAL